jgi:general secretion pathway protein D
MPFLRYFFSSEHLQDTDSEILIVVIPHIIRKLNLSAENLRSIASGTDTNPAVRLDSEVLSPTLPGLPGQPATPAAAANTPRAPGAGTGTAIPGSVVPGAVAPNAPTAPGAVTGPGGAPTSPTPSGSAVGPGGQPGQMAQLRFDPPAVSLKVGQTSVVGLMIQDAQDLYSMPVLLQFNPAIISVEDVRQGGFLSGGGAQPVAIVQRVDKERGQAIISATRMPNTPGISGSGTVFGIVVRGVAPGPSQLSILQVNARNSQQQPLALVTSEATVNVAP